MLLYDATSSTPRCLHLYVPEKCLPLPATVAQSAAAASRERLVSS